MGPSVPSAVVPRKDCPSNLEERAEKKFFLNFQYINGRKSLPRAAADVSDLLKEIAKSASSRRALTPA